jgi:quinol monooxygenase YgiN
MNRLLRDAARRIAAFDKVAVAGIKKLVDVATLPGNDELAAGLAAYFGTAGRPENPAVRRAAVQELPPTTRRHRNRPGHRDRRAATEPRPNCGDERLDMSVVVVVTAVPLPEHRGTVIAAFEKAIARVHQEPGVERYALHEGPDRLVMIEKYESEEARSAHTQRPALADLPSTLDGKLRSRLDAQVLTPHPSGTRTKVRCSEPLQLRELAG